MLRNLNRVSAKGIMLRVVYALSVIVLAASLYTSPYWSDVLLVTIPLAILFAFGLRQK